MESTSATGPFDDRYDAGRRLAGALRKYGGTDAVVVGLARGGVEVGAAVAEALQLPLQALVVRKVGAPHNPELAVGAVSETGVQWIDHGLEEATGASPRYLADATAAALGEAKRQQTRYGRHHLGTTLHGRVAILVDDGIATGASALVAIRTARDLGASRVVLATPVASIQALSVLQPLADDVIVLVTPRPFRAVGLHYRRFDQFSDEAVLRRLNDAAARSPKEPSAALPISGREVTISAGSVTLPAILSVPPNAVGIVVFAHGSGSGRLSPRNRAVAQVLDEAHLATLLADLLTADEARDRRKVFDVDLLAHRVLVCVAYARHHADTANLPCGLFGASTGAAAALVAATVPSAHIKAVVSRGGRPDLAADALEAVRCPTLLLVGSADTAVIALNRHAIDRLHTIKQLNIIPEATHLFEEPGTLEAVAHAAQHWFRKYLPD